jgi:DNA-binding MarR family transcriptional regulator
MSDTPQTLACTCFKLRKLTRAMSRLYDQHMAAVGLKITQYSVLANMARAALPVAELAERLGTERTTLTRNLKPLIDAGWAQLVPGPDARQKVVTMTDAGRAKLKQAQPHWRRAQAEIEATLGVDAVRALHLTLDTTLTQLTPPPEERCHADHQ